MPTCKRLIEVAMPIKEVSAESVRDKSIRHGHISTLHLWWARRPLPVCRAVVFASLVPDPLDEECPKAFKDAVARLLADKACKPYDDIPFTPAVDPMEDNLRNRLLMFVGKIDQLLLTESCSRAQNFRSFKVMQRPLSHNLSKNLLAITSRTPWGDLFHPLRRLPVIVVMQSTQNSTLADSTTSCLRFT
jgi:hypothetical protein